MPGNVPGPSAGSRGPEPAREMGAIFRLPRFLHAREVTFENGEDSEKLRHVALILGSLSLQIGASTSQVWTTVRPEPKEIELTRWPACAVRCCDAEANRKPRILGIDSRNRPSGIYSNQGGAAVGSELLAELLLFRGDWRGLAMVTGNYANFAASADFWNKCRARTTNHLTIGRTTLGLSEGKTAAAGCAWVRNIGN